MSRRLYVCSLLSIVALAGSAQATVLWDQSTIDLNAPVSLLNTLSNDGNTSYFGMSDISVPAGGWTVQRVSTYFSALSWFGSDTPTTAVLNVFPKTGALPVAGNNPTPAGSGVVVPVTQFLFDLSGNGVAQYSASGLNINLAAGDYWIGLTPIAFTGGFFGPDLQWASATTIGSNQAYRMYNPNTAWADYGVDAGVPHADGAILIEGTAVPGPASLGLLGLGGLVTLRRRR